MGIKNLWPLLHRTSATPVNLSTLRGQKVGIDFSLWLIVIMPTDCAWGRHTDQGEIQSHIAEVTR